LQRFLIRIGVPALLAIAVVLWGAGHRTSAAVPDETIRIAILKNAASVTVDGDGVLATRDNGAALALTLPVAIKATKSGIEVNGMICRQLRFSAPLAVHLNARPYRGIIEVTVTDRGLLVVNELPLEDYLTGLINCEISSAWPIEAVKAQAVIARTYAINRKNARKNAFYHLESTVMDQVYEGCLIEDSRARRAVAETSGEVLTYDGAIIQAFYHSNCGGRTEAAANVWGGTSPPYLKGVDCQYCLTSPSSAWEQRLTLREIGERLKAAGIGVAAVTDIRPGARNNRGRLRNVVVVSSRGETAVGGDLFRKSIGYGVIKSTNFTVTVANGEAVFSGLGNGHGVGLCQWGAKQRALDGFGYGEILSYYYPGTELKRLSDIR